ncbi:hypothetical protein FIU97_16605 [Roseivivax sp. THAF40]|nr:hypothetical protein FIV09_16190 [Roseivivax sp. THAF197b]QFT48206.1 hypothetical protein FIU97_16605 [Roseivivax sp. THAF40]
MLNYLALDEKERAQTRVPDRTLPEKPPILPELLTLFDGKCAFCEEARPDLVPFRFRPPNGIDDPDLPDAHIYYGWMAQFWQNLYPICRECHPGERQSFPITGTRMPVPTPEDYEIQLKYGAVPDAWIEAEEALLLDPCIDDDIFETHFEARPMAGQALATGLFYPISERGRATALHFNLNRPDLVARRNQAIADALNNLIVNPLWSPFPTEPFSGLLTFLKPFLFEQRPGREAFIEALKVGSAAPSPEAVSTQTPPHRLTEIRITNFKALSEITLTLPDAPDPDTAAALLILGENATGKSSLLEGVTLAALSDAGRDKLGETAQQYLLDPRYMGVEWMKPREAAEVRLTYRAGDTTSERVLTVTPEGFATSGPEISNLPIFAYGAYRHYQSAQRNWRADRPVRSLFHSDDLLSNPERWLLELDEAPFDMVVRALRVVMGGGFRIIQREEERCLVVVEEDGVSLRTPLATVSSGFRTILALTCDMMRWIMARDDFTTLEAARALVLIDEVEAHLHPRWKVSIMDGLRRAFPSMTFIVTTHDPLCLRGMRDGEVMVLQRVPGQSRDTDLPVFVDTLRELPDVTKLTIEQLLTSDLFDLFDTDDPRTGHAMADLADALAVGRAAGEVETPLPADVQSTLARFRAEVQGALPVGSTEVARIVEEAVAEYVIEARNARTETRRELREETKARIKRALSQEAG